ncbi:MAG: leucyl aminopeptidase family protein, partial [Microvirga sp.]
MHPLLALDDAGAVPIRLVTEKGLEAGTAGLSDTGRAFAAAQGFEGKPGAHCLLPGPDGGLEAVLFGLDEPGANGADGFLAGKLPTVLPAG